MATPSEEPKAQVIDLMEALKASLGEAPAAESSDGEDDQQAATG